MQTSQSCITLHSTPQPLHPALVPFSVVRLAFAALNLHYAHPLGTFPTVLSRHMFFDRLARTSRLRLHVDACAPAWKENIHALY